ncbi:sigma-G-dependent sporulation-specific acid-soluble spore protein CsgA [Metabacillus malikii]|uniref:Sporulation protein n=1 Tax=Metabacillus malikii TaxID=1504265 RepID=A0ABT9ZC07_9BACI|nr:sigma-G-dependent sporulation-specific acid-soluble spore protein CsgA [Metabacillus malikii]MDQ0228800.1 hypothetical protein [Metabacillus malikii]
MDFTLGYLREALSNYEDNAICLRIYKKLKTKDYNSEVEFVRVLDEEEIHFLNNVLPKEIKYAFNEQDFIRGNQLNEVYELLF